MGELETLLQSRRQKQINMRKETFAVMCSIVIFILVPNINGSIPPKFQKKIKYLTILAEEAFANGCAVKAIKIVSNGSCGKISNPPGCNEKAVNQFLECLSAKLGPNCPACPSLCFWERFKNSCECQSLTCTVLPEKRKR